MLESGRYYRSSRSLGHDGFRLPDNMAKVLISMHMNFWLSPYARIQNARQETLELHANPVRLYTVHQVGLKNLDFKFCRSIVVVEIVLPIISQVCRSISLRLVVVLRKTVDNSSNCRKSAIWILHSDSLQSNFLGRIVVSTREDGIANEHHLLQRNTA